MAMLGGITKYTTSGDVLVMGMCDAEDICAKHGVPREQFRKLADQFLRGSRALRDWNVMAYDD